MRRSARHGTGRNRAEPSLQAPNGASGVSTSVAELKRFLNHVERLLERSNGREPVRPISSFELEWLSRQLLLMAGVIDSFSKGSEARRDAAEALLGLAGGALGVAVIRLIAVIVRRPLDDLKEPGSRGISLSACGLVRKLLTAASGLPHQPARNLEDFAIKLLRTQILQAFAHQMASSAAEDLSETVARRTAWDLLTQASVVFGGLTSVYSGTEGKSNGFVDPSRYDSELAVALYDSNFVEHLCQLLLKLLLAAPDRNCTMVMASTDRALRSLSLISRAYCQSGSISEQLRAALSGPCVQYVVLSLGIALLRTADGGSMYGMPPEVQSHVSALYDTMTYVTPSTLSALFLILSVRASSPHLNARAALPLLLRLCRLVVAVSAVGQDPRGQVSAAAAAASPGASSGSTPTGGETRSGSRHGPEGVDVVLQTLRGMAPGRLAALRSEFREEALLELVFPALRDARALLDRNAGGGELVAAAAAEEEVEWWRLVVATVTARGLGNAGSPGLWLRLGTLVARPLLPEATPWTPHLAPPPAVAAALAGGLLPGLECLLRRAFGDCTAYQYTVEAAASGLHSLCSGNQGRWRSLAPLLAYGDPREAASLVATVGKVLRRFEVRWEVGHRLQAHETGIFLLAAGFLYDGLRAASRQQDATLLFWRGSPAAVQLGSLLSYASSVWLPPLSTTLVNKLAPTAIESAWRSEDADVNFVHEPSLECAFCFAVGWILMLAHSYSGDCETPAAATACCQACGRDSGAEATADGAAGSGAAAGGAATAVATAAAAASGSGDARGAKDVPGDGGGDHNSWKRDLLFKEANVVGLLDAALCLSCARLSVLPPPTLDACFTIALRFPQQLRSALFSPKGGVLHRVCGPFDRGVWSPALLRHLASRHECIGTHWERGAEILAALLEAWSEEAKGAGAGGAVVTNAEALWRELEAVTNSAAGAQAVGDLPPPSAARRLVRTCAHPGCTRLEGDSEAFVPLQACGRCGKSRYCCRECQVAHWRAAHGAVCGGK